MTGANYTHRDLAKAVGVTVTTIKSYRRKFPAFLPVESQGKPLRLAGEALAVCKRIHHHFHRGLSVVETRKRLATEFPALAQAASETLSTPSGGSDYAPGHGTDFDRYYSTTHEKKQGTAFGPEGYDHGGVGHTPEFGHSDAAGHPAAPFMDRLPAQPEPLARIEALMGDLFSLQNRTHSLMAELVSKLDTLTGQLAASLPGAAMVEHRLGVSGVRATSSDTGSSFAAAVDSDETAVSATFGTAARREPAKSGSQTQTRSASTGTTDRDLTGARGQHRAGMSAGPGEPWAAPSGTGVSARKSGAAPQPGSGLSARLATNSTESSRAATTHDPASSSSRQTPGSPAYGSTSPSRTAATAGTAPEGAAPAGTPSGRTISEGAGTLEAGRHGMPAAQPAAHGAAPAGTLSTGSSQHAAAPDAHTGNAARPGADFLGLTVVVQSERGEFLGVTGKNGRPFDLGQFESYLLRRAEGLGSFKAAWRREGPDWVLELFGQSQVHAHHFHKATTPKGNTVALFASLTVGGKAVSETSLQSFLRQVKESLGD